MPRATNPITLATRALVNATNKRDKARRAVGWYEHKLDEAKRRLRDAEADFTMTAKEAERVIAQVGEGEGE